MPCLKKHTSGIPGGGIGNPGGGIGIPGGGIPGKPMFVVECLSTDIFEDLPTHWHWHRGGSLRWRLS